LFTDVKILLFIGKQFIFSRHLHAGTFRSGGFTTETLSAQSFTEWTIFSLVLKVIWDYITGITPRPGWVSAEKICAATA
jgi:hypothetical protein